MDYPTNENELRKLEPGSAVLNLQPPNSRAVVIAVWLFSEQPQAAKKFRFLTYNPY